MAMGEIKKIKFRLGVGAGVLHGANAANVARAFQDGHRFVYFGFGQSELLNLADWKADGLRR